MQTPRPNQANIVALPLVAKASGNPITSGSVNFYLIALDGTNIGKWFKGSDNTWQVAEAIAGVGTHKADGDWWITLASAAWTINTRYRLYAKESGDLHIPVKEEIQCKTVFVGSGAITFTYTLTSSVDPFLPIPDADVWVTTDVSGAIVIASGKTDQNGQVVFYLDAGTVYVWRQKSGWDFDNPDTEVIS